MVNDGVFSMGFSLLDVKVTSAILKLDKSGKVHVHVHAVDNWRVDAESACSFHTFQSKSQASPTCMYDATATRTSCTTTVDK